MGVKPDMFGKGGIADDHFAAPLRLAQARHGVGHHFDMVGQNRLQRGAQLHQSCGKGGLLRRNIGVNLGAEQCFTFLRIAAKRP